MQKKWNVLIVPNSPGRNIHSFEVSLKTVRTAVAVTAFFVLLIGLTVSFVGYSYRNSKVSRICFLENEIKNRDAELSQLNREFVVLKDLEAKLRTMAGLEPPDQFEPTPMGGGQGGPYSATDSPDISGSFLSESSADSTPLSPQDLVEGSSELKESLEEVLEIFQREKARLSSIPSINPVSLQDAWISSGYGYREDPITGEKKFHEGIDIVAPRKTPVLAPADGIVSFSGWSEGMGRMVEIEHGYGFTTRYGHNSKLAVKRGDMVKRGDIISYVGSSGRSTGPHLHYEVRYNGNLVNPYKYLVQ
jgi:murein DD-endopeptidase MepM/ murein hydrolase activator NlpD